MKYTVNYTCYGEKEVEAESGEDAIEMVKGFVRRTIAIPIVSDGYQTKDNESTYGETNYTIT